MKVKEKLELELNSECLKLYYEPISADAIFDICDYNGSICHSGVIEGQETVCKLENISQGSYVVYVIDAGEIHTKAIRI